MTLSRELADRASRSHDLAERLSAGADPRLHRYSEAIHHFDDQARDFQQRIESGRGCRCEEHTVRRGGKEYCCDFCANAQTTGQHQSSCRCGHPECSSKES